MGRFKPIFQAKVQEISSRVFLTAFPSRVVSMNLFAVRCRNWRGSYLKLREAVQPHRTIFWWDPPWWLRPQLHPSMTKNIALCWRRWKKIARMRRRLGEIFSCCCFCWFFVFLCFNGRTEGKNTVQDLHSIARSFMAWFQFHLRRGC